MSGLQYGWYVLATDGSRRLEFKVAQALHQSERPALVPFEEKRIKHKGKRFPEKIRVPLYPSYVFVQLETSKVNDEFYNLRDLKVRDEDDRLIEGGVRGLLSRRRDEFDPLALTEADAELIKHLSENGWKKSLQKKEIAAPFRPGVRVKILAGPFAGFAAIVDTATRKRIDVMANLFGRMTVVSFDDTKDLAVA